MQRKRATQSGALFLALLVLAALVAPAANAHVEGFNATLSLQYKAKTQTFFGSLDTNRKCKKNRLVTLYDADTDPDTPVTTTTTDANGSYSFSFEADGGTYYTRVEEEVRGGYGHVHTCEGAQSRTIDTSSNSSALTTGTQGSDQNQGAEMSIFRIILALFQVR